MWSRMVLSWLARYREDRFWLRAGRSLPGEKTRRSCAVHAPVMAIVPG
jgi:hypothetical protein